MAICGNSNGYGDVLERIVLKIARVFPTKTNMTPTDKDAYSGTPDLFTPNYDEIHISTTFTWDIAKSHRLADAWRSKGKVKIGGVAIDGESNKPFQAGIYLKKGITITSRGCINNCSFCLVRRGLVEFDEFPEGNIIQDNNILACSDCHWRLVISMLKKQRAIEFKGGLDKYRTGGFPCQPFSCAGKRKGTSDDRHLWPKMFRVIQLTKPTWVVAENVRGLLTIEQGVVFKQVCLDLESEGYEVQPFIIPAVAVNAPHRRDRVWIVANRSNARAERVQEWEDTADDVTDTENKRSKWSRDTRTGRTGLSDSSWSKNWLEVATKLCGVDDGLPTRVDGFELTKARHRVERLKSLGNSIVPQVAVKIMKGIKYASET